MSKSSAYNLAWDHVMMGRVFNPFNKEVDPQDYEDYESGVVDAMGFYNDDSELPEPEVVEDPDIDPMYEHDSSMESAGWGTDEDYGYYGGDEYDC